MDPNEANATAQDVADALGALTPEEWGSVLLFGKTLASLQRFGAITLTPDQVLVTLAMFADITKAGRTDPEGIRAVASWQHAGADGDKARTAAAATLSYSVAGRPLPPASAPCPCPKCKAERAANTDPEEALLRRRFNL